MSDAIDHDVIPQDIVETLIAVRDRAYVPYSNHPVGAWSSAKAAPAMPAPTSRWPTTRGCAPKPRPSPPWPAPANGTCTRST